MSKLSFVRKFGNKKHLIKIVSLILSFIVMGSLAIYERFHPEFLASINSKGQQLFLPLKSSLSEFVYKLQNIHKLIEYKTENLRLKEELAKLKAELQDKSKIVAANKAFNEYIQIATKPQIGEVIGFEKQMHQSHIIVLCKGFKPEIGQVVTSDQGLVGFVSNVHSDIALVQSITDARTQVPAKTKSGINMIIRGGDDNKLISNEIKNRDYQVIWDKIKVGDIIYTSGEGGMFSQNIPVCKITKINPDKNEVNFAPIVDFNSLAFVRFSPLLNL